MSPLFTRFEMTQSGWVGLVCRHGENGITSGCYVIPWGSKRTVRRALKQKLRLLRS